MKAGLTARMAVRRSAGSCGSCARRSRHRAVGEMAERQREVGLVLGHQGQEIARELRVAVALNGQAELPPQAGVVGALEARREGPENLLRLRDRRLLLVGEERQQGLGE